MTDWDTLLTFVITPRSGPLRKMLRLRDAQQALIADLPPGFLRRAHWLKAGKALVTAADRPVGRERQSPRLDADGIMEEGLK